jgi:hypothetical protein
MNDFYNEGTDITGPADLFRMPEIPQAQDFEGMKAFTENFGDILGNIIDTLKDILGFKNRDITADIPNDEYLEKVSDVLKEVFTPEVVKEWPSMSMEQRAGLLDEYAARLGEAQGINIKGIMVADLYAELGEGTQGMNDGNGILYLDYRNIQNPEKLGEILDTTTHEARHQLQFEAIQNPGKFNIPMETIEKWEANMANYVDPEYDYEGYYYQPVEVDARYAAAIALENLRNSLNL